MVSLWKSKKQKIKITKVIHFCFLYLLVTWWAAPLLYLCMLANLLIWGIPSLPHILMTNTFYYKYNYDDVLKQLAYLMALVLGGALFNIYKMKLNRNI